MPVGSHAERAAGNEPHIGLLLVSGRRSVRFRKTHANLYRAGMVQFAFQQRRWKIRCRSIPEPEPSIRAGRRSNAVPSLGYEIGQALGRSYAVIEVCIRCNVGASTIVTASRNDLGAS
jgi:hypothetical protein